MLCSYSVGQKSKVLHVVHIFAIYWSDFHNFFTSGLCEKISTQWHGHHTYVATLPCKI